MKNLQTFEEFLNEQEYDINNIVIPDDDFYRKHELTQNTKRLSNALSNKLLRLIEKNNSSNFEFNEASDDYGDDFESLYFENRKTKVYTAITYAKLADKFIAKFTSWPVKKVHNDNIENEYTDLNLVSDAFIKYLKSIK